MKENGSFDVIIVGGSYAGMSAALALGRSLRQVLIINGGQPCNRQTPHSYNFLTHDGSKPAEITKSAREQVLNYDTVQFRQDIVLYAEKLESGFMIRTQSGNRYRTNKILFATGIVDLIPNIKGMADCCGISVIHCPYCHGYEFRNQKTGIFANGDKAFHLASLVSNLTDCLTIFTNGPGQFSKDQIKILEARHIDVVESNLKKIVHRKGRIEEVEFNNGDSRQVDALYAALPFRQHCDMPAALGCEITDQGYIQVDIMQRTTVSGIYACGDCASPMRSIANGVAGGNMAGAAVNMELAKEEFL